MKNVLICSVAVLAILLVDGTAMTKVRVRGALERMKRRLKRMNKEQAPLPPEKVDRLVFYTLRHSYASIALQNGASIFEVSNIMGHSSVTMTDRVYGRHRHRRNATAAEEYGRRLAMRGPNKG